MAQTKCDYLANDFTRIASLTADLAAGFKVRGTVMGPAKHLVHYELGCARPQARGEFGPGDCGVYTIVRSGPGLAKLKVKDADRLRHVGNLYGLIKQLGRDTARLWGCPPSPTSGFDGARRTRRRRRRAR
jgi:hypothetical protein